jgi:hypothetical protein
MRNNKDKELLMDERIIKKLYETFRLSTRQGQGGMTFKYVPNEDVINRMNEVFQGNWSTRVNFRDVVDDQVILEVEVSVIDPESGAQFTHTGFGSQQIMRYNSGQNAGKIIDIGNGYKGALAKAIVNACTRWGVGLFKESNPMSDSTVATEATMPNLPPAVGAAPAMPVVPPVETTTAAPVIPPAPTSAAPMVPPVPNTAAPVVPPASTSAAPVMPPMPATAPPVETPPVVVPHTPPAIEVPTPPAVNEQPVVENTTVFPPPMAPNQPVSADISIKQEEVQPSMPKIPAPDAGMSQAPSAPAAGLSDVSISDVQKVALNGILQMNNAVYDDLAAEAFQANSISKPVPPREELSYEEAVVVIKYGNEKFRKNR